MKKIELQELNGKGVISLGEGIHKIESFRDALDKVASSRTIAHNFFELLESFGIKVKKIFRSIGRTGSICPELWFIEGGDIELLPIGATEWIKGKIKFKIEVEIFVEDKEEILPDASVESTTVECPLDDIRQMAIGNSTDEE